HRLRQTLADRDARQGLLILLDGRAIHLPNPVDRVGPVPAGDHLTGALAQVEAERVVVQDRSYHADDLINVPRLVNPAGLAVFDQTRNSASPRHDYRAGTRHRFQHDVTHRLRFRGIDERIGGRVGLGKRGALQVADEVGISTGEALLEL